MKRLFGIICCAVIILCNAIAGADDIYRVAVESQQQADILNALSVEPLLQLRDGYLVFMDEKQLNAAEQLHINSSLIAADVLREDIGVSMDPHAFEKAASQPFYNEGGISLFRISQFPDKSLSEAGIVPIERSPDLIRYTPPLSLFSGFRTPTDEFDSMMALVEQDSVESYLYRLEAFYRRLTGTDSCYAARDWIAAKLLSFGYDSVYIDNFTGSQLWPRVPVSSDNVVATKIGTVYPDVHIIIGGHFDAVPDCPGADDNGTGTVGVLEIARVLADFETERTLVFIAFDSEESWMWGSYHYADEAMARGDNIEYMMNIDMIGHYTNSTQANLYNGSVSAYSELWASLAEEYVGIYAYLAGSTASDHLPFQEYGIPVTFVQEGDFSTHYHQPSDSTTYINFEYMTRMIKASLLTVISADRVLPKVELSQIRDVGNGEALYFEWTPLPANEITHYRLHYYPSGQPALEQSVFIDESESSYTLHGLALGQAYSCFIMAYNDDTHATSIAYSTMTGTPWLYPALPTSQSALPVLGGIRLNWSLNNTELDFDHYEIIRDGEVLPDQVAAPPFIDDDPTLGTDMHQYLVVGIDADGYSSDTTGAVSKSSRTATLREGKILAINRAYPAHTYFVDHVESGAFLEQAMAHFDADIVHDTTYKLGDDLTTGLMEFIDYELVVIGEESGRIDMLAEGQNGSTLLNYLDHYLSIGGKVVIFGRWGDISTLGTSVRDVSFPDNLPKYLYCTRFDVDARKQVLTYFHDGAFDSDCIGAHSQNFYFPDLEWDSLLALQHTYIVPEISGLLCPSFVETEMAPLYTYDSRTDDAQTEGQTVAWEGVGEERQYVFFEMPLSMMDRSAAKLTLQMGINWLLKNDCAAYLFPSNEYNAYDIPETIEMEIDDLEDGRDISEIDLSTLLLNNTIMPDSAIVRDTMGSQILYLYFNGQDIVNCFGILGGVHMYPIHVAYQYIGEEDIANAVGFIRMFGSELTEGDVNRDGSVNLGDAVFLIAYIFRGGEAPFPLSIADTNCDEGVNLGDAVYLINYIFRSGPPPGCD
ncbi:MAG: M28 family peptidase [Candidatus Zixiibacteriota bacterium]